MTSNEEEPVQIEQEENIFEDLKNDLINHKIKQTREGESKKSATSNYFTFFIYFGNFIYLKF